MNAKDKEAYYKQWAEEIIEKLLAPSYAPYFVSNLGIYTSKLAKILSEEVPTVVQEEFCSDCDYVRRCER